MVGSARYTRPIVLLMLTAFVAVSLVMAGCLSPGDRNPADGGEVDTSRPGVYPLGGGRSRVVGTVVYRDLEGGFWAIAGTDVLEEADMASNLAVLMPSGAGVVTEEHFAEAEGRLVVAEGVLSDGPSIYMAGPLFEVDQLEVLGDTEP